MKSHLATREAVFEFQVQTQTDATSMPVEDPTRVWDEIASPPRTVARLTIPAGQEFDTDERKRLAEHLGFTPWHTRPEHEPLGGINLVRRKVYESLAEFRRALNHDVRSGDSEMRRSPPAVEPRLDGHAESPQALDRQVKGLVPLAEAKQDIGSPF